jgi:hypothetical protein
MRRDEIEEISPNDSNKRAADHHTDGWSIEGDIDGLTIVLRDETATAWTTALITMAMRRCQPIKTDSPVARTVVLQVVQSLSHCSHPTSPALSEDPSDPLLVGREDAVSHPIELELRIAIDEFLNRPCGMCPRRLEVDVVLALHGSTSFVAPTAPLPPRCCSVATRMSQLSFNLAVVVRTTDRTGRRAGVCKATTCQEPLLRPTRSPPMFRAERSCHRFSAHARAGQLRAHAASYHPRNRRTSRPVPCAHGFARETVHNNN